MARTRAEGGHALVEALFVGLILLVPVIWMLTVFGELHAAALATSSAARESGFEAARSADVLSAEVGVQHSVAAAMADHGLDPDRAEVAWTPAPGWSRGGDIEVMVTYRVPVFQAPFLGAVTEPYVSIRAHHLTTIDRYRSRPE